MLVSRHGASCHSLAKFEGMDPMLESHKLSKQMYIADTFRMLNRAPTNSLDPFLEKYASGSKILQG